MFVWKGGIGGEEEVSRKLGKEDKVHYFRISKIFNIRKTFLYHILEHKVLASKKHLF